MTTLLQISLDQIDEPNNAHRLTMDETALNELADSIRDVGLLNPIVVRPTSDDRYEIIAGHRRYLAMRQLRLPHTMALVRDADNDTSEAARFAENLQREQLSPMEEAVAITRYIDTSGKDIKQVARALNRSEWWVLHRVALLAMPDELKDMVHAGKLAAGAAIEIAKITDDSHRRYLMDFAVRSGATVGVIREWVNQWELQQSLNPDAEPPKPPMPVEGQEVIISMPCYLCGVAHDHRVLTVQRVCRKCDYQVNHPTTE